MLVQVTWMLIVAAFGKSVQPTPVEFGSIAIVIEPGLVQVVGTGVVVMKSQMGPPGPDVAVQSAPLTVHIWNGGSMLLNAISTLNGEDRASDRGR